MESSLYFIVGSPGRGKTILIKEIIHNKAICRSVDYGIVICPTIYNNSYDFIPETYRYPNFDAEVIKKLMVGQKTLKRKDINKNAFIIFDDCIGNAEWNNKIMKELITCYRHLKITIIIASQYCYSIPPLIRSCCSIACIFKPPNKKSIQCMLECFFHDYNDIQDLKEEFDKLDKYEFIEVKCNNSIEDNRYTVKVAKIYDFKLSF